MNVNNTNMSTDSDPGKPIRGDAVWDECIMSDAYMSYRKLNIFVFRLQHIIETEKKMAHAYSFTASDFLHNSPGNIFSLQFTKLYEYYVPNPKRGLYHDHIRYIFRLSCLFFLNFLFQNTEISNCIQSD